MFRARLARVYWFSPLGRTSRWRIFGYGPDAYLVSWSYRRTYAGGDELGVLSWDGSWAFLGAPRVSSALSLVPSRHFVSLGADGGCFSGHFVPLGPSSWFPRGTSCLLGRTSGRHRRKAIWHESEARWLSIRTLFATLPWVKVADATCLCGVGTKRKLYGARVRQDGF